MTTDYLYTSHHIEEDFSIDGEKMEVEFFTTQANTTAYQIANTQGAEFGKEAERVRMLFEAAPELLEALQNYVDSMLHKEHQQHWFNTYKNDKEANQILVKAIEVIKKAKG